MRRLILHIGWPKTGSSFIQLFLYNNRAALLAAGLFYPVDETVPRRNHNNLGFSLSHSQRLQIQYSPEHPTLPNLSSLLDRCRDCDVLVSAETLSTLSGNQDALAKLAAFARAHDLKVDVVAFLRAQNTFIESIYAERCTRVGNGQSFRPFISSFIEDERCDYHACLCRWAAIPNFSVIAVPFTISTRKSNPALALFEAAGLCERLRNIAAQARSDIVNPRASAMLVEISRRASSLLSDDPLNQPDFSTGKQLAGHFRTIADARNWSRTPYCGLTNQLSDQIRRRFARGNDLLAQQHWGCSWHDIFAADYDRAFTSNDLSDADPSSPEAIEINEALIAVAERYALSEDRLQTVLYS